MKITIIGVGMAGSVFAEGLARAGADVIVYDQLFVEGNFNREVSSKLLKAGVGLASDIPSAVATSDVVISLTGESGAEESARMAASAMEPGQMYIDMNLYSPLDKEKVCAVFPNGIDVVDGTIMKASVVAKGLATSVFVAGAAGQKAANMLNALGMRVSFVDKVFGAACGIKLLRGLFMKSIETTLMEGTHAAACLGIQDSFLSEISRTFRETHPFDPMLHDMITTNPNHAMRHGNEMNESVALLKQIGIDDTMGQAVRDKFFYLGGLELDETVFKGQIPGNVNDVLMEMPNPLKKG